MTKRKIKDTVSTGEDLEYDDSPPIEISGLVSWIKAEVEKGATHIKWRSYDRETLELTPVKAIFETDAELQKRIDRQEQATKRYQETQLKVRRRQFEELKKEFENEVVVPEVTND